MTSKKNAPAEAVDGDFIDALMHFAEADPVVRKCHEVVCDAVFRNEWRVRWGDAKIISFFEQAPVRRSLERLLRQMRLHLRVYGFVGIYHSRRMDNWIQDIASRYRADRTLSFVDEGALLPFGVIPPGTGTYVRIAPNGKFDLTRSLQFMPSDKELEKRYNFSVYAPSARFYDARLSPDLTGRGGTMGTGVREMTALAFDRGTTTADGLAPVVMRPYSAFLDLSRRYQLLREADDNRFDAAFSAAHPSTYAVATAMPRDPIENVDDITLRAAATLSDARSGQRKSRTPSFTMAEANNRLRALYQHVGSAFGGKALMYDPISGTGVGGDGATTSGEEVLREREMQYRRPTAMERMITIPEHMQVTQGPPPVQLIDVLADELEYEKRVCTEMGLPHVLYRTDVETKHSSGQGNITLSMDHMNNTVRREQEIYGSMFAWVYATVFAVLDRVLLEEVATEVAELRIRRTATGRASRRDVENELRLVEVMEGVTRIIQDTETAIKLEFELLLSSNEQELNAMITAQQLGLVDRHLVERNASRLFGHTLGRDPARFVLKPDSYLRTNFNAPLMPPPPPHTAETGGGGGGGASNPKKRKAEEDMPASSERNKKSKKEKKTRE